MGHDVVYWRNHNLCGPVIRFLARTPHDSQLEACLVDALNSKVGIIYDSCRALEASGYVQMTMNRIEGMDRTQRCYKITMPKGIALARLLDT